MQSEFAHLSLAQFANKCIFRHAFIILEHACLEEDGIINVMYTAYYLPSSPKIDDQSGFETSEAAWDWIKENHLCKGCYEKLEQGFEEYGTEDDEDYCKFEITHPGSTSCGAEWGVGKTEDLDNAESMEDVFSALGWEKVYERDSA